MLCLITYYKASVKICNRNALFVTTCGTNLQRKRFLSAQTLQTLGDQMQVCKRVWIFEARSENGCGKWHFWSEIGSGFGDADGTLPPKIPRSTPPPPGEDHSPLTVAVF